MITQPEVCYLEALIFLVKMDMRRNALMSLSFLFILSPQVMIHEREGGVEPSRIVSNRFCFVLVLKRAQGCQQYSG